MWIICAGAKRSGSTLQYNLISNLVEKSGLGKRIPHFKTQEFSRVKNEFKILYHQSLNFKFLK